MGPSAAGGGDVGSAVGVGVGGVFGLGFCGLEFGGGFAGPDPPSLGCFVRVGYGTSAGSFGINTRT